MSSKYMERLDRLLAYSSGKNYLSNANKHYLIDFIKQIKE